jgi:ADP-ribose pyrophosphatase YjhB (NUDIX family)
LPGPVIIEKINGRFCVLLNKHKKSAARPNPKWQFPGGKMENFDVSLQNTAKREVKEEMGIKIKIIKPLETILVKQTNGSLAILIHYLAKRIGKIKPSKDIAEWSWWPLNKLPKNCAPNIKPIIDKLK